MIDFAKLLDQIGEPAGPAIRAALSLYAHHNDPIRRDAFCEGYLIGMRDGWVQSGTVVANEIARTLSRQPLAEQPK